MKETIYVVYFEGCGYYAKNQPNYEWSYTMIVLEANDYKTRDGALERIRLGSSVYNHNGKILMVERQLTILNEESFSGQTPREIQKQTKKAAKEEALRQKMLKARENYVKKLQNER